MLSSILLAIMTIMSLALFTALYMIVRKYKMVQLLNLLIYFVGGGSILALWSKARSYLIERLTKWDYNCRIKEAGLEKLF